MVFFLQVCIVNVKLSLYLTIKHYTMKAYEGVDVYIHIFLTSALTGGEWSVSRPGRFTSGEITFGTHWIGGWVGPRAGLDDVEKRKFLTLPGRELRPLGCSARSQSLYRLNYPGSFRYTYEHFVCISVLSSACYVPRPAYPHDFIIIIRNEYKSRSSYIVFFSRFLLLYLTRSNNSSQRHALKHTSLCFPSFWEKLHKQCKATGRLTVCIS
jgi:hypothetical protein